jgi:hypothetical protein
MRKNPADRMQENAAIIGYPGIAEACSRAGHEKIVSPRSECPFKRYSCHKNGYWGGAKSPGGMLSPSYSSAMAVARLMAALKSGVISGEAMRCVFMMKN